MEKLLELYTTLRGTRPRSIEALPKAGSNRHYVRLTDNDGESLIGVISDNIEENQCFVYLSRHFAGRGLPVPHVLAVSRDGVRYLQTDLGRTSLYNALEHGRQTGGDYNAEEKRLIEKNHTPPSPPPDRRSRRTGHGAPAHSKDIRHTGRHDGPELFPLLLPADKGFAL